MKIKFPKSAVIHRRKQPRPSIVTQNPFFGVPGKVLTYRETMSVYYKVQEFLDLWDVETEIDYRESEGDYTKEEATNLRREMQEVADEYRAVLDDDGHWNEVLVGIMDLRRAGYENQKMGR